MKVIIAGSRSIVSFNWLCAAMEYAAGLGIRPTKVVSGMAPGVDLMGVRWAGGARWKGRQVALIPVIPMPAKWRVDGEVNWDAGKERNQRMAEIGDALVALWDGESGGTRDMVGRMERAGKVYVVYVIEDGWPTRKAWRVGRDQLEEWHRPLDRAGRAAVE